MAVGLGARGVALRLDAVRVVRQVEVDGREAVADTGFDEVDRVDAAEGVRLRAAPAAAAAEGHGGLRVAGPTRVDGDRVTAPDV